MEAEFGQLKEKTEREMAELRRDLEKAKEKPAGQAGPSAVAGQSGTQSGQSGGASDSSERGYTLRFTGWPRRSREGTVLDDLHLARDKVEGFKDLPKESFYCKAARCGDAYVRLPTSINTSQMWKMLSLWKSVSPKAQSLPEGKTIRCSKEATYAERQLYGSFKNAAEVARMWARESRLDESAIEECRTKRLYYNDFLLGAPSANRERFVFDEDVLQEAFGRPFEIAEIDRAMQEAADNYKRSSK